MSKIINAYTVDPMTIQQGDVAMHVVKVVMTRSGKYRLYRCLYDPSGGEEVPQGSRVFGDVAVICQELFPSIAAVAKPDY